MYIYVYVCIFVLVYLYIDLFTGGETKVDGRGSELGDPVPSPH